MGASCPTRITIPCPIKLSSVSHLAGIFVTKLKTVTNTVPRSEITLKTKGAENPKQDASLPTSPASSNTNLENGPGGYRAHLKHITGPEKDSTGITKSNVE